MNTVTQTVDRTAKQRIRVATHGLCLVGALFLISACSTPGDVSSAPAVQTVNPANPVMPTDRTILLDMLSVVTQIFDPFDTTLQVNNADTDPTLQYFIDKLVGNGYGIQRVSADQGANYVSLTRSVSKPKRVDVITYSVSIGAVEIERDYTIPSRNVVEPASMVRLSGTRVAVAVNDKTSGRKRVTDPSLSQAEYFATLDLDAQAPVISIITPKLVQQVSARTADGPSLRTLNTSNVEVNNLFNGGESAFSSLLDDYNQIQRQIIVFGDDSLVLGETNKSLLDQFVESQYQRGDIISLVGCSNGPTSLEIGNEGLALGRAKRVTVALMTRGIEREQVFNEGCWAPVSAGDAFPNRGVVLELWRENT